MNPILTIAVSSKVQQHCKRQLKIFSLAFKNFMRPAEISMKKMTAKVNPV